MDLLQPNGVTTLPNHAVSYTHDNLPHRYDITLTVNVFFLTYHSALYNSNSLTSCVSPSLLRVKHMDHTLYEQYILMSPRLLKVVDSYVEYF